MSEKTQLSAAALLDTWSARKWDNGVQLEALDEKDTLVVVTQNSTYEITLIAPRSSEVLIRGGRFFEEFTPANIAGSSLGGSFLKLGGIYTGFSIEIHANEQVIVTS